MSCDFDEADINIQSPTNWIKLGNEFSKIYSPCKNMSKMVNFVKALLENFQNLVKVFRNILR